MEFEALRIASLLAFLAISSYFDIFNRKNVPVGIPYAMIALGIILNLATMDFGVIVSSATVALLIVTVGYVIYRTGQIGGADVLIFTGIALLVPSQPAALLPLEPASHFFLYPFVFSAFLISGFLALIGLSFQYVPAVSSSLLRGETKIELKNALLAVLVSGTYIAVVFLLVQAQRIAPVQALFISALALLAGFLTLFKDKITLAMIEWVPLGEIDEEDVIALNLLKPSLVKKLALDPVVTRTEREKLKKSGLKSFPIFKGMPAFLPYVFFAALLVVVFGDPLAILINYPG
jgi:preflagellin peptidase FlaK